MTRGRTGTFLRTYAAAVVAALCVAATDLWGSLGAGGAGDPLGMAWRLAVLALALAPVAAALLALAGHASLGLVRRSGRSAAWTLPYVLLAAPWLVYVAIELFSGGSMRRLPLRGLGIAATVAGLLGAVHVACLAARRVRRWVRRSRRRAAAVLAAAAVAVAATAAVNQTILPGLYEYLHASLAGASFLVGFVAASAWRPPRLDRAGLALGGVVAVTAVAVLALVVGLSRGHALRAAMHRPRAPASRAVLQWVGPFLPAPATPAVSATRRHRVRSDAEGLPRWDGAHVLLVTIDALRADRLGAYGYERGLTPSIDALARDGVVFERAYTQAPHSSYSLCSLMASEYLHETLDLGQEPPAATLPRVLGAAGYRTAGLYPDGIFHTHGERLVTYRDTDFGFDVADHRWLDAEAKTDAALAVVDELRSRGEVPSLLWVHYFDVHEPYRETALGTSLVDRYDGEVRNVDRAVERLVREARGRLSRDVVVVISADHGEELRDHGGLYHGSSLYEEQVRVPLIVNAPGLEPRRVSPAVELVDVAPTLLAGLGLDVPSSMRGDDLRGLLAGEDTPLAPAASAVGDYRGVFDGRWKLIADQRAGVFELYDLQRDPAERRNLADSHPEQLARLHGELRAWLRSLTAPAATPTERALEMARLGDARAAPRLATLLDERSAPAATRAEAVRALAELGGPVANEGLRTAARDPSGEVAAEAVLALGERGEPRARWRLLRLLEGPHRERAALALARLGDRRAVPALIEALAGADRRRTREHAARWLGRLDDRQAFDPLLAALEVPRVRRYAAEALGDLGDPRALPHLLELLDPDLHVSVRIGAMRGLGWLGDGRSAPALARLAVDAPEILGTTEALVRVGALERGDVGGLDFAPGLPNARRCRRGTDESRFVDRTTCELAGRTRLPIARPPPSEDGYTMFVRGRAEAGATRIDLSWGDAPPIPVELGPEWIEHRLTIDHLEGEARWLRVAIPPGRVVELDHALLVPVPPIPRPPAPAPADGASTTGDRT